jgi:alkanesulfonate monooxygenase SsuD/methylene tetrahydromethanopterin reductase-like flavin-dependent oxidoreductase (luciferase family)
VLRKPKRAQGEQVVAVAVVGDPAVPDPRLLEPQHRGTVAASAAAMRYALMIEGQEGVGWDDWLALARAAERHGFEALLRSDHYLPLAQGDGALDAWGTICALAAVTERIRLGTLVSPVTFRPAAVLAKLALTADHISGGRIDLGIGTGWHEDEHRAFDFPFPPMPERFDELERQLEEIQRIWRETGPPPVQQPRPRLVMGGAAKPRGARLAARHADEYNVVYASPEAAGERHAALEQACEAVGRDPATLTFSVMTGFVVGADEREIRDRAAQLGALEGKGADELLAARRDHWLIGTPEQIGERLGDYERAGVERIAMQHLLHTDLDAVALLARLL